MGFSVMTFDIARRTQLLTSHLTLKLIPLKPIASSSISKFACLLFCKKPRLLIAVQFPRNLHWDRDDPLKFFQITLLDTKKKPTRWHKHPTFPIAAIELGLFRDPILDKLAPCTFRTIC